MKDSLAARIDVDRAYRAIDSLSVLCSLFAEVSIRETVVPAELSNLLFILHAELSGAIPKD